MRTDRNFFWRYLYKLHRYLGLLSAIVLIMLSITGIALNHTESLSLDSRKVSNRHILDHYNIQAPTIKACKIQQQWVSQLESHLYFDSHALLTNPQPLIGCLDLPEYTLLALKNTLILLSTDAEIIEQLSHSDILRLGKNAQNHIIIETHAGIESSSDDLVSWQAGSDEAVTWSTLETLPNDLSERLKHRFRGSIVPWERVILDMHSGRFFGQVGVIIVDLTGISLILLSSSGCIIWLKHKLRTWSHRR